MSTTKKTNKTTSKKPSSRLPKNKVDKISLYGTDLYPLEQHCIEHYVDKLTQYAPTTYVEVGVWTGGTFEKVLSKFDPMLYKAYGIDLFEDFKNSKTNTHESGTVSKSRLEQDLQSKQYLNFELIKGDSVAGLKQIKRVPAGVIFIDGNHTYNGCMRDLEAAYDILGQGFILVHNASNVYLPDSGYVDIDGGPYKACNDFLTQNQYLVDAGFVQRIRIIAKGIGIIVCT